MEVRFALLSDYALQSRDGKLSVMGIFDQIRLPKIPSIMPQQMWFTVSIQGATSEVGSTFTLQILFWDQDGNELFGHESDFTFSEPDQPGLRPVHSAIIGILGMRFNHEGDHSLIVNVNGEERRRTTIKVTQVQPPPDETDD